MPEDIIYIRYIGQTAACSVARHRNDYSQILGTPRSASTRFINNLRLFFAETINMAVVQEFFNAAICVTVP